MTRRVLAAVEDLLFKSKISETASSLGIEAAFPPQPRRVLEALRESPHPTCSSSTSTPPASSR